LDIYVFLAVMAAAAMHAGWNALLKGGGDPFDSMARISAAQLKPVSAIWPMPRVRPLGSDWMLSGFSTPWRQPSGSFQRSRGCA